jgi:diacylglycerol kinase (ATP)
MRGSLKQVVVVFNPNLRSLTTLKKNLQAEADKLTNSELLWLPAESGLDVALAKAVRNAAAVVVLGGDGLVRAAAKQLVGTQIPLGIVPSGTGNLLARNMHIPVSDSRKAIRIALGEITQVIDVARATLRGAGAGAGARAGTDADATHIFTVMAGVGLDAAMAGGVTRIQKKRYGWLAYVAPIVRSIVRNSQHQMVLRLDDRKPVPIKAHTAIVGNCGTLTANLLLLPEAQLTDGLLDIVVLNPKAITGWTQIWSRVAVSGALVRSRPGRVLLKAAPPIHALQYGQFRQLELTLTHPQPVQLDGDVIGEANSVSVEVLPAALVVRVPSA